MGGGASKKKKSTAQPVAPEKKEDQEPVVEADAAEPAQAEQVPEEPAVDGRSDKPPGEGLVVVEGDKEDNKEDNEDNKEDKEDNKEEGKSDGKPLDAGDVEKEPAVEANPLDEDEEPVPVPVPPESDGNDDDNPPRPSSSKSQSTAASNSSGSGSRRIGGIFDALTGGEPTLRLEHITNSELPSNMLFASILPLDKQDFVTLIEETFASPESSMAFLRHRLGLAPSDTAPPPPPQYLLVSTLFEIEQNILRGLLSSTDEGRVQKALDLYAPLTPLSLPLMILHLLLGESVGNELTPAQVEEAPQDLRSMSEFAGAWAFETLRGPPLGDSLLHTGSIDKSEFLNLLHSQ